MDNPREPLGNKKNMELIHSGVPCLGVEELTPLQTQVAGHHSSNGKSTGLLRHPDGYVLKPVDKKAQEKEIWFYDYLNSATDSVVLELKEFVPKYYGTRSIRIKEKDVTFIALENLTDGMYEPCVMDIKVGKQTWEPDAPEEKINIEKEKYKECKKEYAFCIPGMQYYSITDCQLIRHGKEYGKKLDKDGIKDELKSFLNWDLRKSRLIIQSFLCKLQKILKWFQIQSRFTFYSSSLLFVYDARMLRNSTNSVSESHKISEEDIGGNSSFPEALISEGEADNGKAEKCNLPIKNVEEELNSSQKMDQFKKATSCEEIKCSEILTNLKMIDFAHALVSNTNKLDVNYLEGLMNLIGMFEILLKETC